MRYNKRSDLTDLVYNKVKELGHFVPKDKVYVVDKAFLAVMIDILANNDELVINDIFKLKRRWVKGRHYKTIGKDVYTKGHWAVDFKPGARLKRACMEDVEAEEMDTDLYENEEEWYEDEEY